jgi:hypothetical protein
VEALNLWAFQRETAVAEAILFQQKTTAEVGPAIKSPN